MRDKEREKEKDFSEEKRRTDQRRESSPQKTKKTFRPFEKERSRKETEPIPIKSELETIQFSISNQTAEPPAEAITALDYLLKGSRRGTEKMYDGLAC
jgi:hypothetical protein